MITYESWQKFPVANNSILKYSKFVILKEKDMHAGLKELHVSLVCIIFTF